MGKGNTRRTQENNSMSLENGYCSCIFNRYKQETTAAVSA